MKIGSLISFLNSRNAIIFSPGGSYLAAIVNTAQEPPNSPKMYYMDTEIYNIQYYMRMGSRFGRSWLCLGPCLRSWTLVYPVQKLTRNKKWRKRLPDVQRSKPRNRFTIAIHKHCTTRMQQNVCVQCTFFQQSSRCSFISCPK